MFLEMLVTVAVLAVCRWVYQRWRAIQKLAHLPEAPALPILGHLLLLNGSPQHLYEVFQYMCGFGDGMVRVLFGPMQYVMLTRAHTVEPVLASSSLLSKSRDYKFIEPFLGEGLVTSAGTKWRSRRKLLTPAFHFKILDDFNEVYNKQARILVSQLGAFADLDKEFNVLTKVSLCALDIIMESSMGWELASQINENCDYVTSAKKVSSLAQYRSSRPWLQPDFLFNLSGYGKQQQEQLNVFHGQSVAAIKRRRAFLLEQQQLPIQEEQEEQIIGVKKRRAFLDLMLEESVNSGQMLSDEDLREEVDTITFAGHDTTSTTVSMCLFFLGHDQAIQARAYEEIMDIVGEAEEVTTTHVKELKYLESCIKETLRLVPAVPIIGREALEEITIAGTTIPAGTTLLVNMMLLHRDPVYFPDPNSFNPERFIEDGPTRPPYAYVPFSAGPRNCIGQKFAMNMAKIMLARVLREYSVTATQDLDRLGLAGQITAYAANGVPVGLKRRGGVV